MSILFVTAMRNEAIHLTEWIAQHRALGVDHFLIYTNDCDDLTTDILDRFAAEGIVTRVPTQNGEKTVQWRALHAASSHPLVKSAEWVAFVDCDEFVSLAKPYESLADLLSKTRDVDGIAVAWRLFGSSGVEGWTTGLTIERFTMAAPLDIALPAAWFFKSIVKPSVFGRLGVHRPQQKKGEAPRWINGAGQVLPEGFSQNPNRINLFGLQSKAPLIQLNHYSLRSAEEFLLKRQRGLPNRTTRALDLAYWVERNWNIVEDQGMVRHHAATKAEVERLTALAPDLMERAKSDARARIDALRQDAEVENFLWILRLAGDSHPPNPQATKSHLARLSVIHKT